MTLFKETYQTIPTISECILRIWALLRRASSERHLTLPSCRGPLVREPGPMCSNSDLERLFLGKGHNKSVGCVGCYKYTYQIPLFCLLFLQF